VFKITLGEFLEDTVGPNSVALPNILVLITTYAAGGSVPLKSDSGGLELFFPS